MIYIGLTFIILGLILSLSKKLISFKNHNTPKKYNITSHNFSVLIPARNESKVIKDLLESIKNQTQKINMKDVYVIIEDLTDPTLKITKTYGATIIMRKKLNLKRKGYALMEAIEYIKEIKKTYDAYFVFDADNILDKDFIKNMTKTYDKGYDIGIGYRNNKNGNASSIAASSSLIFSVINTLGNDKKTTKTMNSTISGTGFYIRGNFIDKWNTYPFHTLTEDYELSLYSITNNMTTYYNKNAIYYDEQPETYRQYKTQRTRWIKGYFEARKLYRKKLLKKLKFSNPNIASVYTELIGVWDIILLIIGLILILISFIINFITNTNITTLILKILIFILSIYLILLFLTIYLLIKEQKRFKLKKNIIIKTIFIHPLLLFAYIPCALKAVFTKNLSWQTIEHKGAK